MENMFQPDILIHEKQLNKNHGIDMFSIEFIYEKSMHLI